jgi:hypothetical protein
MTEVIFSLVFFLKAVHDFNVHVFGCFITDFLYFLFIFFNVRNR